MPCIVTTITCKVRKRAHKQGLRMVILYLPHGNCHGVREPQIKWKLYNKSLELREVSPSGEVHCQSHTSAICGCNVAGMLKRSGGWRSLSVPLVLLNTRAGGWDTMRRVTGSTWLTLFQSLYMTRFVIRKSQRTNPTTTGVSFY